MKRYLLPNSAKKNPVYWERTKQTIQSLLSSSDAHDKLEDFVLEMIAKNGVPDEVYSQYIVCLLAPRYK